VWVLQAPLHRLHRSALVYICFLHRQPSGNLKISNRASPLLRSRDYLVRPRTLKGVNPQQSPGRPERPADRAAIRRLKADGWGLSYLPGLTGLPPPDTASATVLATNVNQIADLR
jgi:hypothetical protein